MTTMKKNKKTIKVSRYTFFIEQNNRKFLYNTLSNALTEVDDELYNYMKTLKTKRINTENLLNDEMIVNLKKNMFLTESTNQRQK